MRDPALTMTDADLRFVASIDTRLHDAERARRHNDPKVVERMIDRPCPGCADRCGQCDEGALD